MAEERGPISTNNQQITDLMLKSVLDEIFNELDQDRSGTLEKDEIQAYASKMQKKLQPNVQFNEHLFESNFHRMDTYASGWVNRDTLFKFILQKAIASGAIDMDNLQPANAEIPEDFVDY